jgi:hypothetical protein
MSEPKVVGEKWIKVISYDDGTTKEIEYPDHRKNSEPPYDGPPSVYNGGLTYNEQYPDKATDSDIFKQMYDKLYED